VGQAAEKKNEYQDRGEEIGQGNRFEYLAGAVTVDVKSEAVVRRRIQVGANA